MKLIDTGILLELLSGSEEDIDRIDDLFREVEKSKEKLFLTEEVVIELVYSLEQVQGWEREVVVDAVSTVLLDKLFLVEDMDILQNALKTYARTRLSFVDCMKVAKAKKKKVREIISFNKKFEKVGLRIVRP